MIGLNFENNLLNVGPTIFSVFVVVCLFVRPKALAASMLLGPDINAARNTCRGN